MNTFVHSLCINNIHHQKVTDHKKRSIYYNYNKNTYIPRRFLDREKTKRVKLMDGWISKMMYGQEGCFVLGIYRIIARPVSRLLIILVFNSEQHNSILTSMSFLRLEMGTSWTNKNLYAKQQSNFQNLMTFPSLTPLSVASKQSHKPLHTLFGRRRRTRWRYLQNGSCCNNKK